MCVEAETIYFTILEEGKNLLGTQTIGFHISQNKTKQKGHRHTHAHLFAQSLDEQSHHVDPTVNLGVSNERKKWKNGPSSSHSVEVVLLTRRETMFGMTTQTGAGTL
jgi:hypothetical protein